MRCAIFAVLALTLSSLTSLALAETCPSVDAIKHQTWGNQWKMYDTGSNKPVSDAHLAQALKSIDQLSLAEWSETKDHMGTIRCYYRDKHGSSLEAYLANTHYRPDNSQHVWYSVTGHLHCAAGVDQCIFTNKTTKLVEAKR
jgi:hypothetical protein